MTASVRGGQLLGHTVDGAEAEDEIAAIDGNDFAAGEKLREGVKSDAVVGIVEDGNKHELVSDVKVGVAGGQTLAVEKDGSGHRKRFDA